jgi:hypothetical protein
VTLLPKLGTIRRIVRYLAAPVQSPAPENTVHVTPLPQPRPRRGRSTIGLARSLAGLLAIGLAFDATAQVARSAAPEPTAAAAASPAPGTPSPAPSSVPAPAASPAPAAPAAAAASPAPGPSGPQSPAAGQAPLAGPSPSPTPNPYHYVVVPPQQPVTPAGAPQIVEVALNERTLEAPGPLLVRITTSPNVGSVTARAFGRQLGIPQLAPGVFGGTDQLPVLPAFLLGRSYDIEFVAATQDGRSTSFTLPVGLR